MRISDWSSDVCSSDLNRTEVRRKYFTHSHSWAMNDGNPRPLPVCGILAVDRGKLATEGRRPAPLRGAGDVLRATGEAALGRWRAQRRCFALASMRRRCSTGYAYPLGCPRPFDRKVGVEETGGAVRVDTGGCSQLQNK